MFCSDYFQGKRRISGNCRSYLVWNSSECSFDSLPSRHGKNACEDSIWPKQILPIEFVLARVICLPFSVDAAKSERKSYSRSVENLVSPWNGYSRAKNRPV